MAGGAVRAGLLLILALVACDPGSIDSGQPVDTADSGMDSLPWDRDGDGSSEDDCDDDDPAVYPGAQETGGDGIDQDCDGSDFPAMQIGSRAAVLPGPEGMHLGEVVTVEAAESGASRWLALTGTVTQHSDTPGHVFVYPGPGAVAGGDATLHLYEEGFASLGRATVFVQVGGTDVLVAGFSAITRSGGACGWDLSIEGELSADDALGCLPPFENDVDDRAGSGLAYGTDVDGDGIIDLVFSGSASTETGGADAAAWYHAGPLSSELLASTPQVLFVMPSGSSLRVFVAGDLDGDGYADLVATDDEAGSGSAGAAYLVSGSAVPGAYPPDSAVAILGDDTEGHMGQSVAVGDLDADGQTDVCLGAPLDNSSGERGGAAACFYGPLAGKQQFGDAPHRWVSESDHNFFGRSLALLDTDGDGADEVAVGVIDDPHYSHGWPGKVYLYGSESTTAPRTVLRGEAMDLLGYDMKAGDLDGDGRDELVVGAPSADVNGTDSGAAYVISGAAGAW